MINEIIDGKWKIIGYKKIADKRARKVIIENIYNGTKLEIWDTRLKEIREGKKSISKMIWFKIKKEEKEKWKSANAKMDQCVLGTSKVSAK